MVGDVGGAELEVARGLGRGGEFGGDLRVLDDAEFAALESDDSDRLGGIRLLDDLGSTVGFTSDAVAEEDGVGDADEAVVDAVGVEVVDAAGCEVGEDGGGGGGGEGSAKASVEAAVAIGSDGDGGASVEEDLTLVVQTREDAYLAEVTG